MVVFLNEFYDIHDTLDFPIEDKHLRELVVAFRNAVMEERLPDDHRVFATLPYDTVLGSKAQAALADLKKAVWPTE